MDEDTPGVSTQPRQPVPPTTPSAKDPTTASNTSAAPAAASSASSASVPPVVPSKRRRGYGVVTPNACTECRKKRSKVGGWLPQSPCFCPFSLHEEGRCSHALRPFSVTARNRAADANSTTRRVSTRCLFDSRKTPSAARSNNSDVSRANTRRCLMPLSVLLPGKRFSRACARARVSTPFANGLRGRFPQEEGQCLRLAGWVVAQ